MTRSLRELGQQNLTPMFRQEQCLMTKNHKSLISSFNGGSGKMIGHVKVTLAILLFSFISVMAGCQSIHDIKFTTGTRGYNKEVIIAPKKISLHEQNFREPDKEK